MVLFDEKCEESKVINILCGDESYLVDVTKCFTQLGEL